jgi:hypothetical protein
MMKTQFAITVMFVLLLTACTPAQGAPALAATINRDCGPADGPAFTVEIPMDARGRLVVSIWQAPEISGRARFTLTDPTDATGSASLFTGADSLESLSGTITFEGVNSERPVQGDLRLISASGEVFEGAFTAEWGDFHAYCG